MWIYIEAGPGVWTVGFYTPGCWTPESDHNSLYEAAARCRYLNGEEE